MLCIIRRKVLEYGVYDMAATNSHGGREAKKPIMVAVSF